MKNQYPDLAKRAVFVIGAASEIGAAQARVFPEQDAFVFELDQKFGKIGEISLQSPEAFAYALGDVRQMKELQQAVSRCQNHFGEVTILPSIAGMLDTYKPLMKTGESLWNLIYETNVKSTYRLAKIALPDMIRQKSGTIINMVSIAGLIAGRDEIAYTSAKHAIAGFTKQPALDYAGQGTRVEGTAPGATQTSMSAADFEGKGEVAEWVANETPVKRWARPGEVTELTLLLASPQASYIQGTIIPADGGWLLKQPCVFFKLLYDKTKKRNNG